MIQQLLSFFATAPGSCEKHFLTFVTWYHYLPASDFKGCDITGFNLGIPGNGKPTDIPYVLIAVIDDLLQIAGLVALGFVIVGGIKYIASQGSPDSTASAQSTVINALIGLAISITGIVLVSFLGNAVGR